MDPEPLRPASGVEHQDRHSAARGGGRVGPEREGGHVTCEVMTLCCRVISLGCRPMMEIKSDDVFSELLVCSTRFLKAGTDVLGDPSFADLGQRILNRAALHEDAVAVRLHRFEHRLDKVQADAAANGEAATEFALEATRRIGALEAELRDLSAGAMGLRAGGDGDRRGRARCWPTCARTRAASWRRGTARCSKRWRTTPRCGSWPLRRAVQPPRPWPRRPRGPRGR
ncbi:unnamed protein product [Prorocentrum cordatum]|uniref:Uncharacterized protein n=1 Tax=Prorocentrum cordatum TaxID=2364126 RepID=A0ABN9V5V4_9DINO|nr:unnamed protein product [Polarella glacialis]